MKTKISTEKIEFAYEDYSYLFTAILTHFVSNDHIFSVKATSKIVLKYLHNSSSGLLSQQLLFMK